MHDQDLGHPQIGQASGCRFVGLAELHLAQTLKNESVGAAEGATIEFLLPAVPVSEDRTGLRRCLTVGHLFDL